MIFGHGFLSAPITSVNVAITSWEAQHVAGVFTGEIMGGGGGGGGTNDLTTKKGEAGGFGGYNITYTRFLYAPSYTGGTPGTGGIAGYGFDPGSAGVPGTETSLWVGNGEALVAQAPGGSGGRPSGRELSWPDYNPVPLGNGGYGGGGWSRGGTVQIRGQNGGNGYVRIRRLA